MSVHKSLIAGILLIVSTALVQGQHPDVSGARDVDNIIPLRARAEIHNEILEWRLENILPDLMRREKIDLWIVMNREKNEDPVYLSMVSKPNDWARRLSILLFHDRGDEGVACLTANWHGTSTSGPLYTNILKDKSNDVQGQFDTIVAYIKEHDPKTIGLNFSRHWNYGDGLTVGLWKRFMETLPETYHDRIVSAEYLSVGWLETRSPQELSYYRIVAAVAHDIIAEAFSNRVIVPNLTTADDVSWWMRQRIKDLSMDYWSELNVRIQRSPKDKALYGEDDTVIRRGDCLWTDFCLDYLGLKTDINGQAYVCRLGETDAPEGVKAALRRAHRVQEIYMNEFKVGRTGNDVFQSALAKARAEGLNPRIYSHPIGSYGHGAGTTIGRTETAGRRSGHGRLSPALQYLLLRRGQQHHQGPGMGQWGADDRARGQCRFHRGGNLVSGRPAGKFLPHPMTRPSTASIHRRVRN